MARYPNWRRIKKHYSYTYGEAAARLGVHPNTVRGWVRTSGLKALMDQRPHLIRGDTLGDFLRAKRKSNRKPLRSFEFYCLKCKAARLAAGRMADCLLSNMPTANLRALCSECGTFMHKRVSLRRIEEFSAHLEIMHVQASSILRVDTRPR